MKKALLIGIFSLLAIAPLRCAQAQAGSGSPAVKAVEKSSAGVGNTIAGRKAQDPDSEAAVGNASAKNQTTPTLVESTEGFSNVFPKSASEAQRFYNTGVTLHDSGKLGEAITAFKEANRLKPNDPQTQYMLGMVYWKAKSFNDSVDFFKLAVKLKPDWAEAYFRLGLTYYVLGRKTQVNEAYKKLQELNSPLADKLSRISGDPNPTRSVESPNAKTPASTTKQVELVPVSAPAASAPLNEKPRATASESKSSSKTAASPDKTTPKVATPNGRPSAPVIESNKAPTGAASPVPAPATATTSVRRTANGEPPSGNEAVAEEAPLTDIYKIGVGDVLDIRLLNSDTNRSTLYSVIEGGLIDFPIVGGPIPVAGLTAKAVQARLTTELKRLVVEEGTQVAVAVRQYASHTVIITGLVGSPGTKILRREAVPLYVLLAEVQPRLDAARATIMRAGAVTQVVDLGDSAALGFNIRPGDTINLTARPQDFYYIGGRITNPGQKSFQPGITLVQAILAAGGSTHNNVVELSRESAGGNLATTKFNLKEIKSGKIHDPKLQPGDRVEVLN
ncbi:MAG: tetratricopeptide repeat protein [Pyrinomonadaceae bacterium]|nr:tetratricopeptide repeat protein [Pyrinomonadaceae bacterium]